MIIQKLANEYIKDNRNLNYIFNVGENDSYKGVCWTLNAFVFASHY